MVRISLKGQFSFKGSGDFTQIRYKIKVLKQLGNKLFVCGDRVTPELIYTAPANKQIVFARIDNSGPGQNDWRVAVMVETIPNKPRKIENYNLQENATGTLIYIGNDSGIIKELEQISINYKEGTIAGCKTYLGNHSCCQIEKKKTQTTLTDLGKTYDTGEVITYLIRYNNDEIQSYVDSTILWDIKLKRVFSNLTPSEFTGRLRNKARVKSTEKPRLFYKPYHHFKPIYDNYVPDDSWLKDDFVSAYETQIFDLIPAKEGYPTKIHEMPGKDGLDNRDSYINGMTDFINICGQNGDRVEVLYAYDNYWTWQACPSYRAFGGATCKRRFPAYLNGVGVPFPCFKASCSVTRIGDHNKGECIRKSGIMFDSYDCRILSGYSFEQTPPFSASFTANGIEINSVFGCTGQLINEGDELTCVQGRFKTDWIRTPKLLSEEKNRERTAQNGYDYNAFILSSFNQRLRNLLTNNYNKFIMDVKVINANTRPYSSCVRPDISYTGGTTGSLYEGEEPRLVISDSDPGKVEEYQTQTFFSLLTKSKSAFENKSIGGYFSLKLTDEDGNSFHQDFYKDITQEQGVTITPILNSDFSIDAFVIPSTQEQLTKNQNATINQTSIWKINKYTLNLKYVGKNDSSYFLEEISTQVLPLGRFDKIISYSYYDAEL